MENTATYWITAAIIVVLLVIGAFIWYSAVTPNTPGVPNTGTTGTSVQTTQTAPPSGIQY